MYTILDCKPDTNGGLTFNLTDKDVSTEDKERFISNFWFLGRIHQVKELYSISEESYYDLIRFLTTDNLNMLLRDDNISKETVAQTGNKLLFNYCTIIKTLVDTIENHLLVNNPDSIKDFNAFCSDFYDNHFEYRFFMRLRNYCIHYRMPYTIVSASVNEDCNLFMRKTTLLEWSKWGSVKKDLLAMPETIAVQPLLKETQSLIIAIYLQALFFFFPSIEESINNINRFCEKYGLSNFMFIQKDKIEDLKNDVFKPDYVPWKELYDCIKEFDKHPKISINYIHDSI